MGYYFTELRDLDRKEVEHVLIPAEAETDIRDCVDECYSARHDILCAQPIPPWLNQFMSETSDYEEERAAYPLSSHSHNIQTLRDCGRDIFRSQLATRNIVLVLLALQTEGGDPGYGTPNFEEYLDELNRMQAHQDVNLSVQEWRALFMDHILEGAYAEKMRILQSN